MKRLFAILIKKENFTEVSFNKVNAFINSYRIILLQFFLSKQNYIMFLLKRILSLVNRYIIRNERSLRL